MKLPFITQNVKIDKNLKEIVQKINKLFALLKDAGIDYDGDVTHFLNGEGEWSEVSMNLYTTKALKVHPDNVAPVLLVSSGTAWTYGSYVEIVPANTIASDIIIIGMKITRDVATTGEWQVKLASGVAGSEIAVMDFVGDSEDDTNAGSISFTPIPVKVSANVRLSAKVSDEETITRNYRVKILYHELPL